MFHLSSYLHRQGRRTLFAGKCVLCLKFYTLSLAISDELRAGTAFYERDAVRIISLGVFMEILEYSLDKLIMHNGLALLHLAGQRLVPSILLIMQRLR